MVLLIFAKQLDRLARLPGGLQLPGAIWSLPELTKLFLSHNQLSGSIPEGVGHMQKLLELVLTSCGLEGTIPPQARQLLTQIT